MKIPFVKYNQFFSENREEILNIVDKTLASGKYIREKNVLELENRLAKICERKYSITTNSCTDALYFALKTCGIKKNDEVIIPSFSYIASLEPILRCGATPVFVDIDSDTLMINLNKLENAITIDTKAIIFVQLFGACLPNFDKLKKIANKNNLVIIEDAAQALGSSCDSLKGGNFGDISCISFDPTKIISAFGTGGAVLTDNLDYYKTVKQLVNHGQDDNNESTILGYNSKIPAINAALINLQLNSLEEIIFKTNEIAKRYCNNLKEIKEIKLILPKSNCSSTFHKFVILAKNRFELKQYLYNNGIETKIHYNTLLSNHKLLKDYNFIKHELQISESVHKKALSLPIYYSLTIEEIDYICNKINTFYSW